MSLKQVTENIKRQALRYNTLPTLQSSLKRHALKMAPFLEDTFTPADQHFLAFMAPSSKAAFAQDKLFEYMKTQNINHKEDGEIEKNGVSGIDNSFDFKQEYTNGDVIQFLNYIYANRRLNTNNLMFYSGLFNIWDENIINSLNSRDFKYLSKLIFKARKKLTPLEYEKSRMRYINSSFLKSFQHENANLTDLVNVFTLPLATEALETEPILPKGATSNEEQVKIQAYFHFKEQLSGLKLSLFYKDMIRSLASFDLEAPQLVKLVLDDFSESKLQGDRIMWQSIVILRMRLCKQENSIIEKEKLLHEYRESVNFFLSNFVLLPKTIEFLINMNKKLFDAEIFICTLKIYDALLSQQIKDLGNDIKPLTKDEVILHDFLVEKLADKNDRLVSSGIGVKIPIYPMCFNFFVNLSKKVQAILKNEGLQEETNVLIKNIENNSKIYQETLLNRE